MDMLGMMNAMQNPQGTMLNYMMQGMISQHPNEWQQAQQMFAGKNRKQQIAELRKIYKERGMDLDATAKQYGVSL